MKAIIALGALATASCINLQREPLLTWKPREKKSDHPVDYFVPNFGADSDIKSSFTNM